MPFPPSSPLLTSLWRSSRVARGRQSRAMRGSVQARLVRPGPAALDIATGQVTGVCKPRHRHEEFLAFLKHVARAYPDQELRLVMDNYAAHKKVEVRDWLAENPRIRVHFTPTSASWMNMVETWFGIIERQAIHRGTFGSVRVTHREARTPIVSS
jgi:transposase